MLLKDFDGRNPVEMLMSEKFDGVRAVWTGSEFLTRTGNRIDCPAWFCAGLPDMILDGEIWAGRRRFQVAKGLCQSSGRDSEWRGITFQIFDAPSDELLEARIAKLRNISLPNQARIVEHKVCFGMKHLDSEYCRIAKGGGEGIVIRVPNSPYRQERSLLWQKVKRKPELYALAA